MESAEIWARSRSCAHAKRLTMDEVSEAVISGATHDELHQRQALAEYFTTHLRPDDINVFDGAEDIDGTVSVPELSPDEVFVAVMASVINYNTVWSEKFEPVPTIGFLAQFGRQGVWEARHDQPYQVVGSDVADVVVVPAPVVGVLLRAGGRGRPSGSDEPTHREGRCAGPRTQRGTGCHGSGVASAGRRAAPEVVSGRVNHGVRWVAKQVRLPRTSRCGLSTGTGVSR